MDDATLPGLPPASAVGARPLSEHLNSAIEPRRAAAWAKRIAEAIATAHARGASAGDLRPSCILIDADGFPRLTHQDPGARSDPARDQFQLGAILYQMLTGRRPFDGSASPQAPSDILASVPRDLEAICLRAIEEDPSRRYPSITEMVADIGRFLAGDPVLAAPRAAPKNGMGPGVIVLVIVIVVGGVASAWHWWPRSGVPSPRVPTPTPVPAPPVTPPPRPPAPPSTLDVLLASAKRKLDDGNAKGAIADLDSAVAASPDSAEARLRRGLARFTAGDPRGAITDLDEAVRLDPRNTEAIVSRAVAKHASGEIEQALADCDLALSIDAAYAPAYLERGFAKHAKKDLAGAIDDYTKALGANPDYVEAFYNRGRARFSKEDLDGALSDYNEAIKRKPKYPEALFQRGKLKEKKGDKPGAMGDYAAALKAAPKGWPQRAKVE